MSVQNPRINTDRKANLTGSLWMVFAMAIFAVEDVLVKASTRELPVGEVLILFGMGGALIFAVTALQRGERLFQRDVVSRPMRFRVFFEIIGRLFYVLALSLTPLSSATVILQATPIVVVAGASLFYGETVGKYRWLAIVVGLIGVVFIISPGAESFSMLSVLAVIGMLGFAGRDLTSRAAPMSLSTEILGFYGFLAIVVAGGLYSLWEAEIFIFPDVRTSLYLAGAILSGVVAYSALMKAMRTGEVSAVTPFRYTRLLFGLCFGVWLFGERLSISMWVGSGLIVASGLFILFRGKSREADR